MFDIALAFDEEFAGQKDRQTDRQTDGRSGASGDATRLLVISNAWPKDCHNVRGFSLLTDQPAHC